MFPGESTHELRVDALPAGPNQGRSDGTPRGLSGPEESGEGAPRQKNGGQVGDKKGKGRKLNEKRAYDFTRNPLNLHSHETDLNRQPSD